MKTKTLFYIAALAAFVVAVAAFYLAFHNVMALATEAANIPQERAWVVPVIVEGAMLALAIARLYYILNNQSTKIVNIGIGVFIIIAIVLNVGHSHDGFWAILIAALQPVSLIVAFETALHLLQHEMTPTTTERDKFKQTAVKLWGMVVKARRLRDAALIASDYNKEEADNLEHDLEATRADYDSLKNSFDMIAKELATITQERDSLQSKLDNDAILLSELPPKYAAVTNAVAKGLPLNGQLVKMDIPQSTLDRIKSLTKT